MSLADTFDAPILETIGGESVSFPIFTMDDIAAIVREIQNEKKAKELKRLSLTAGNERQEIAAYYDDVEMDIDQLARDATTIPGAIRILRHSLVKSGNADPGRTVLVLKSERGWRGVVSVACQVSGLWPPVKKQTSPNVEAANANADAAKATDPASTGV